MLKIRRHREADCWKLKETFKNEKQARFSEKERKEICIIGALSVAYYHGMMKWLRKPLAMSIE